MSFTMPATSPTWPLLPSTLWIWDCSSVPKHGTTCSPVPTGTQVTAQSRTAHQRFSQPKESSEDCFTPLLSTPPTSLQPAGAMRGCDRKSVLITVSLFIPHFSSAINSCRELAPRFQTSSRYDTGFSSRVFKLQLQKQKNIYMRLGKRVRKSGDQGHLCPWTDFLSPPHNSLQSPAGNPRVFINLSLPCSPGEHRCSAQRQEGADQGHSEVAPSLPFPPPNLSWQVHMRTTPALHELAASGWCLLRTVVQQGLRQMCVQVLPLFLARDTSIDLL